MYRKLLRDYQFELMHPEAPLKYHSTFFFVQSGLNVYISKRQWEWEKGEAGRDFAMYKLRCTPWLDL